MKKLPSRDVLKSLLEYHPETGQLAWKQRDRGWFSDDRSAKIWNKRFPGKPALSTPGGHGRLSGYLLSEMTKAHRVIWKMAYGTEPDCIDHIDGDPANNRLENMREVSQAVNTRNASMRSDNKSGVTGVHFDQSRQRYMAYVSVDGKRKMIGRFDTFDEAVAARLASPLMENFHENHGRPARDDRNPDS